MLLAVFLFAQDSAPVPPKGVEGLGPVVAGVIALLWITREVFGLVMTLMAKRSELKKSERLTDVEVRKLERADNREERADMATHYERLVALYGQRLADVEEQNRQQARQMHEQDQKIDALEEKERKCQKMLGRCVRVLKAHDLWESVEPDSDDPPSPVPRPPEAKP